VEVLDQQKITLNKEMAKRSFHLLEHRDSGNSEGEKKLKCATTTGTTGTTTGTTGSTDKCNFQEGLFGNLTC
jgi:hypothetical protein